MEKSEFGKGLCYCLGLFLAHTERYQHDKKTYQSIGRSEDCAETWFNAASDHMYELEIPKFLPRSIRKRLKELKDKTLHWGHGYEAPKAKDDDVKWAIDEAKTLLRLLDEHFGVSTVEASYS